MVKSRFKLDAQRVQLSCGMAAFIEMNFACLQWIHLHFGIRHAIATITACLTASMLYPIGMGKSHCNVDIPSSGVQTVSCRLCAPPNLFDQLSRSMTRCLHRSATIVAATLSQCHCALEFARATTPRCLACAMVMFFSIAPSLHQ
jgi:hypothetical protein